MNYEIGPIRPPSESNSLLVRVTRGCHWNKCYFCGLYKGMPFSVRPTKDIICDIENMAHQMPNRNFESCFLQDGDALNIPTDDLLQILNTIKSHFPHLKYITTYARADTIKKKSLSELELLREAGLNHFYRGIETGSDIILEKIHKGITAADIIESGLMSKSAGIMLSDFTLLGIGGKSLSEENALETARVINAVNPEFIRVHHTALKPNTKLGHDVEKGLFDLQSEVEIVQEQRLFIENLKGITSYYVNEHIVNLLLEVRGKLPDKLQEMLSIIDHFLDMPDNEQLNFSYGRRLGVYYYLSDIENTQKFDLVKQKIEQLKITNPYADFDRICNSLRSQMI